MENFIELNLVGEKKSQMRVLRSDLSLFPDEKVYIPNNIICCADCGISNAVTPIAVNGYCSICNHINQHIT